MNILMVCLGNICRSPLAEGILQNLADTNNLKWNIDSAGTSGWHDGEAPDPRSISIAQKNNINIKHQVSRKVNQSDFDKFDLILAMDATNFNTLKSMCPSEEYLSKIQLIMNFAVQNQNIPVPDPYYDGNFQRVFDMLTKACNAIVSKYS